jgi:hypothetical protein
VPLSVFKAQPDTTKVDLSALVGNRARYCD